MKRVNILYVITIAIYAIVMTGCTKLDDSIKPYPYYADIVSCDVQPDSTLHFEQILANDQGSITLVPDPSMSYKVAQGKRVLLQFYQLDSIDATTKRIEVIQLSPILSDTVRPLPIDSIDKMKNDILKISTAWRTGDYLNLNLQIEYNNISHRLGFFYDPEQQNPDTLDVYLRHDNNGDAMGYWIQTYTSYYIPQFNTYRAMRIHANMPDVKSGYLTLKIKD